MLAPIIIILLTLSVKLFYDSYCYNHRPIIPINHGKEWAISAIPYGLAVLILRDMLGIPFLPGFFLCAIMVASFVLLLFNGLYGLYVIKKGFWYLGDTAWSDRLLKKLSAVWHKAILIGIPAATIIAYAIIYFIHH